MKINKYADTHPINEEDIVYFYRYWDFELDRYEINMNEFIQVCCLLKCLQADNEKITFAVHHLYRMLDYTSIYPAIKLLHNISKYKERQEKADNVICEEMCEIYRCSFGARCVWMIASLVNEFDSWDEYKVNL